MRDQLVSVSRDELSDNRLVRVKTGHFFAIFRTLQRLEHLKFTNTRLGNLAEKRQEKHKSIVEVGNPAPPLSPQDIEEVQRIASISDPSQSSVDKQLFYASYERKSEQLGNDFCDHVLGSLFSDDPTLDWVVGRPLPPTLQWTSE